MSLPVDRDLNSCREDIFGRVADQQSTYQAAGWLPNALNLNKGVIRGLLELWSWGLARLYEYLKSVLAQAFPASATDDWLDLHCEQVGITRRAQQKAKGLVIFGRETTGGNVLIKAGRVCKTLADGQGEIYRYVSTEDVVLPAGELEIGVPVESEAYGAAANAAAGAISELSTVVSGIDFIRNDEGWLTQEGYDTEDDTSLQLRYMLRWKDINGCTKYAYMSWAYSVAGVIEVAIHDQHPRGQGTVDVIIRGSAGQPTQKLIDAVTETINPKVPVNDDFLVKAPVDYPVAVSFILEISEGDTDEAAANAETAFRELFEPVDAPGVDSVAFKISEDFCWDRVAAQVLPHVSRSKKIINRVPDVDMVVEPGGLLSLQSLRVSAVVVSA